MIKTIITGILIVSIIAMSAPINKKEVKKVDKKETKTTDKPVVKEQPKPIISKVPVKTSPIKSPTSRHRELQVEATAYTDRDPGCKPSPKTRDKTGKHLPGVAVDPKIIPIGSKVSTDGGKTWVKADDTGGAIKGHRIDIRMDKRPDALKWGRRKIKILVQQPEKKK